MSVVKFVGAVVLLLIAGAGVQAAISALPATPAAAAKPTATPSGGVPIRELEKMPADGLGAISVFPCSKSTSGMKAILYVPRYYQPGKAWPLLVEVVSPGHLGPAAKGFLTQAEFRGYILLAMECSFMRENTAGATTSSAQKVWNREGGETIHSISRPLAENIKDMTADSQAAVDLVKQAEAHYTIDRRSVAMAGMLGSAVLAYRQPGEHPDVFKTVIMRTGDFKPIYLAKDYSGGVDTSICIIYGANEPADYVSMAKSGAAFFKERKFKSVSIEEIPNSGVDYRPEIVTNYFLGAFNEKAGPDRAAFDRATNRAGICLVDDWDPDTIPAPESPKVAAKSDAAATAAAPAKAGIKDVSTKPTPQAVDPAKALAALDNFVEGHPKAKEMIPYCRFISARLLHEKLHNDARAEQRLREFTKPPFLAEAVAPDAIVYLVDKVLGPTADPKESLALLRQAMGRSNIHAETAARAKELIHQLTAETKP